jgi:hypothetical protein
MIDSKILLCVLLLGSFSANAQDDPTKFSESGLQLGLSFTPSLGFTSFIQDDFLPP